MRLVILPRPVSEDLMKPMSDHVVNIVVAGLGGQGVLKASDILRKQLSPPVGT